MWTTILLSWPRHTRHPYVKMPNQDRYVFKVYNVFSYTRITILDYLCCMTVALAAAWRNIVGPRIVVKGQNHWTAQPWPHRGCELYRCSAQVYSAVVSNYDRTDFVLRNNRIQTDEGIKTKRPLPFTKNKKAHLAPFTSFVSLSHNGDKQLIMRV